MPVRKTANLHTGGTIHDVTDEIHPRAGRGRLARRARHRHPGRRRRLHGASRPREPDYVFIEANERPGLANHEPQPTAERFVDLLFPQSMPRPRASPAEARHERRELRATGMTRLRDRRRLPAPSSWRALLAIPSPTGYTDNIVRHCSRASCSGSA